MYMPCEVSATVLAIHVYIEKCPVALQLNIYRFIIQTDF